MNGFERMLLLWKKAVLRTTGGNELGVALAALGLTGIPLIASIIAMILDFNAFFNMVSNAMNLGFIPAIIVTLGIVIVADIGPIIASPYLLKKEKTRLDKAILASLGTMFMVFVLGHAFIRFASMKEYFSIGGMFGTVEETYVYSMGDIGMTMLVAFAPLGTSLVVLALSLHTDTERAVFLARKHAYENIQAEIKKYEAMMEILSSMDYDINLEEIKVKLLDEADQNAKDIMERSRHWILTHKNNQSSGTDTDHRWAYGDKQTMWNSI